MFVPVPNIFLRFTLTMAYTVRYEQLLGFWVLLNEITKNEKRNA